MDLLFRVGWALARWGAERAEETAHTVAQLPPTCKEALAHAVIVCAGGAPRYFPPGWGPLCSCWGWFGLGALMGACFALLWLLCRPARGAPAPQPPWLTAAREVLDCVAEGGHAELRGLAGQAGMPVEAPDGYLLAPFQEALLQLYGGASLAAEIAGTADVREPTSPAECRALAQRRWRPGTMRR
ncbi:unnamed protein product, partial [Effrenium voratum]